MNSCGTVTAKYPSSSGMFFSASETISISTHNGSPGERGDSVPDERSVCVSAFAASPLTEAEIWSRAELRRNPSSPFRWSRSVMSCGMAPDSSSNEAEPIPVGLWMSICAAPFSTWMSTRSSGFFVMTINAGSSGCVFAEMPAQDTSRKPIKRTGI